MFVRVNGKTWNCTDEGLVVRLNATGEDVINEQGMDNIAVGGGEISGIICRAQWEQLECDWCERVDKPRLLGVLSASCDSLTRLSPCTCTFCKPLQWRAL